MRVITSLKELEALLSTRKKFHLYGAGVQAQFFLDDMKACGIEPEIESILVTDIKGNPGSLRGISVIKCDKEALSSQDCIILTVNDRIKEVVIDCLKDCDAELVDAFPAIYYDVYDSIKPFADNFPDSLIGLNQPAGQAGRIVWTCWWQGEDKAPDLVKACWQSQRNNLSDGVRHVIITKDNFSDYITIPDYVLDKFENGKNRIAHLADFVRACLLYKYGGVWLDSTVLLLEPLPEECWSLPLYTWRLDAVHFNSQTIWATWFIASCQGSVLYQFVMEAFLYYFTRYDKVKYYLTIDYFISICTNLVEGVLEQFQQIPYNNRTAVNLGSHLNEPYSESRFREYCKGSFLQKLNWHGSGYGEGSVYSYIVNTLGEKKQL